MELLTSLLDFIIGLTYGNWKKFLDNRKRNDALSLKQYIIIFFGFLVLFTAIYTL
jgi:hypothetical protein